MNANIRTLAAVAALLSAGFVRADDEDSEDEEAPITFERYRSITERYPFGVPPPNFDPTDMSPAANAAAATRAAAKSDRELTQEENKLKAALRLCAFNLTPERRVMVGFVDNSRKPPQSFYMALGETRGGWTVKSADVDERTAVVERDGIEVELEFPKPGATPVMPQRGGGGAGMRPGMPMSAGGNPGGMAPGAGAPGNGSALDRLRERRAQMAKNAQEEEERRKVAAEKEKADKAAAAEEREQQKQQLLMIQEELRRAREQREQREREQREEGGEGSPVEI